MITNTPNPSYYAVIFSSIRTKIDNGYEEMANRMIELAKNKMDLLELKVQEMI